MSDFLSETEGCDLLARLFRARGYAIARNLLFREYGVEFHVDGWDAKARVGFEFLSSEDDDHDDLTLSEYQTLATAQQRGELALFVIDEVEPLSASDLALQANEFLDEVADARQSRRSGGSGRKLGRVKAAGAKKPSAGKKKATAKKAGVKKNGAVANKVGAGAKSAKHGAAAARKKAAGKKAAGKKAAGKKVAKKKAAGKKLVGKKAARRS